VETRTTRLTRSLGSWSLGEDDCGVRRRGRWRAKGRAKNGDVQGARLAGGERNLGGARPAGGEGVTLEDPRPSSREVAAVSTVLSSREGVAVAVATTFERLRPRPRSRRSRTAREGIGARDRCREGRGSGHGRSRPKGLGARGLTTLGRTR
jgi:hypothetical protein